MASGMDVHHGNRHFARIVAPVFIAGAGAEKLSIVLADKAGWWQAVQGGFIKRIVEKLMNMT